MKSNFFLFIFTLFIVFVATYIIAGDKSLPKYRPPQKSILMEILSTKTLNVSVSDDNEPLYIYEPKSGYPGFEVEIARDYANFLEVELKEVMPMPDFEQHARALHRKKVHFALGNSSSLKRAQKVDFSDPYMLTSPGALVNKLVLPPEPEGEIVNNNPFKSVLDLTYQNGITISIRSSTSNEEYIKKKFGGKFPIYTYFRDSMALNALTSNRVNCYIADNVYIQGQLQKHPSLKTYYKALLSPVIRKEISIAINKYDVLFLKNLNFFIREMKRSGRLNALKQKYFESNVWVRKK